MFTWQWYRCIDPEVIDTTYWMLAYSFGERPVWLNHYGVWGWVYAVDGMALWCNFRSCSWQLWVESKLKASCFRYLGGEDQQSTVKLGLTYGHMRLSQLSLRCVSSDTFPALSLAGLAPFENFACSGEWTAGLDREADFWLLGYFNIFRFIWIIRLLRLRLRSCSNFFCLSHSSRRVEKIHSIKQVIWKWCLGSWGS